MAATLGGVGADGGFLAALSPAEAEALVVHGRRRRYARGEYLMREGETSHHVALLIRGRVKVVTVTEDGREVVLSVKGPGELLGEISTLDGGPRTADVLAIEPVEALLVPAASFSSFLAERPHAALVILRIVLGRLRDAGRRRAEFGHDTASRVARQLMELAQEHGREEGRAIRITLPLSHDDLAAMVGASRETVSRALGLLRDRGLIETGGGRFAFSIPTGSAVGPTSDERAIWFVMRVTEPAAPSRHCGRKTPNAGGNDEGSAEVDRLRRRRALRQ